MDKANKFKGYDSIFATKLRALMAKGIDGKKITQQDLAAATGYTRQAISQYMDGSVMPNAEKLAAISEFFNVSADYLLGLSESETINPELRAARDYTGLSTEALERLHEQMESIESFRRFRADDEFLKYITERESEFKEELNFINTLIVTGCIHPCAEAVREYRKRTENAATIYNDHVSEKEYRLDGARDACEHLFLAEANDFVICELCEKGEEERKLARHALYDAQDAFSEIVKIMCEKEENALNDALMRCKELKKRTERALETYKSKKAGEPNGDNS